MDTDVQAEVTLFEHIDFCDSNTKQNTKQPMPPKKKIKRKKKKKTKQKQELTKTPKISQSNQIKKKIPIARQARQSTQRYNELDSCELLFIPKEYDPTPSHTTLLSADISKKKNYLEKIKQMTPAERRAFRSKRDLRYLHKRPDGKDKLTLQTEILTENICLYHLTGPCDGKSCNLSHQMRLPRLFGVCKFYITGTCAKGEQCEYMHSEFPCRFYHLDMPHPKNLDENKCRFKHGGPLSATISQYFLKHIEHWIKSNVKDDPNEFERIRNEYIDKFEMKQMKLENAYEPVVEEISLEPAYGNASSLKNILTEKQIKRFSCDNITTMRQLFEMPVAKLEEYGLTIDQIYQITVLMSESSTTGDSVQIDNDENVEKQLIDDSFAENEQQKIIDPIKIKVDENSNSTNGSDDDFIGFSSNITSLFNTDFFAASLEPKETSRESNGRVNEVDDIKDSMSITEIENKTQNSDSQISDDENSLIINEDLL